jgi:hypothetical protein
MLERHSLNSSRDRTGYELKGAIQPQRSEVHTTYSVQRNNETTFVVLVGFRVFSKVVARKAQASKAAMKKPIRLAPLNFNVDPEFKREFKVYAAEKGVSMIQLLKEGFALIKAQSK